MVRRADRPWKLAPYPTDVGTFVIEAAITDLDTSVVPNIPRGYVLAGAFESDVKLLSVWLQE